MFLDERKECTHRYKSGKLCEGTMVRTTATSDAFKYWVCNKTRKHKEVTKDERYSMQAIT